MQSIVGYVVVVHKNGTLASPSTDMTLTQAAGCLCR